MRACVQAALFNKLATAHVWGTPSNRLGAAGTDEAPAPPPLGAAEEAALRTDPVARALRWLTPSAAGVWRPPTLAGLPGGGGHRNNKAGAAAEPPHAAPATSPRFPSSLFTDAVLAWAYARAAAGDAPGGASYVEAALAALEAAQGSYAIAPRNRSSADAADTDPLPEAGAGGAAAAAASAAEVSGLGEAAAAWEALMLRTRPVGRADDGDDAAAAPAPLTGTFEADASPGSSSNSSDSATGGLPVAGDGGISAAASVDAPAHGSQSESGGETCAYRVTRDAAALVRGVGVLHGVEPGARPAIVAFPSSAAPLAAAGAGKASHAPGGRGSPGDASSSSASARDSAAGPASGTGAAHAALASVFGAPFAARVVGMADAVARRSIAGRAVAWLTDRAYDALSSVPWAVSWLVGKDLARVAPVARPAAARAPAPAAARAPAPTLERGRREGAKPPAPPPDGSAAAKPAALPLPPVAASVANSVLVALGAPEPAAAAAVLEQGAAARPSASGRGGAYDAWLRQPSFSAASDAAPDSAAPDTQDAEARSPVLSAEGPATAAAAAPDASPVQPAAPSLEAPAAAMAAAFTSKPPSPPPLSPFVRKAADVLSAAAAAGLRAERAALLAARSTGLQAHTIARIATLFEPAGPPLGLVPPLTPHAGAPGASSAAAAAVVTAARAPTVPATVVAFSQDVAKGGPAAAASILLRPLAALRRLLTSMEAAPEPDLLAGGSAALEQADGAQADGEGTRLLFPAAGDVGSLLPAPPEGEQSRVDDMTEACLFPKGWATMWLSAPVYVSAGQSGLGGHAPV